MRFQNIVGLVGASLCLFSPVFLVPIVVAWIYGEPTMHLFSTCFVLCFGIGCALWVMRDRNQTLRPRDSFLIVSLVYVCIALLASLPYVLIPDIAPNYADALFEAFSSVTTTGASVLVGLDDMPKSLLFYRQLVCWFGGMGIIVLAVAILPMLGVGGMDLMKAEMSGDEGGGPLHFRIRDTAKTLWTIYLGLTVACAIALRLAGMSVFDAIAHSLSTISIGGFSTHDASIGYFDSTTVEIVMLVFIVLSGCNFMRHYVALHPRGKDYWLDLDDVIDRTQQDDEKRRPYLVILILALGTFLRNRIVHFVKTYAQNDEVRLYLIILAVASFLICFELMFLSDYRGHPLRDGVFHTISFMTTTGFTTVDLNQWPEFCTILLLFISFVGACAGSTGGGFKVFRIVILLRQGLRELQQLIQPGAIFYVRMNGRDVSDRTLEATMGFVSVYAMSFMLILWVLLIDSNLDFETSFSAVTACMNNLGPGLGQVAVNYQSLNSLDKLVLTFAMLLGRLEIFTFLVLFTPNYWRR